MLWDARASHPFTPGNGQRRPTDITGDRVRAGSQCTAASSARSAEAQQLAAGHLIALGGIERDTLDGLSHARDERVPTAHALAALGAGALLAGRRLVRVAGKVALVRRGLQQHGPDEVARLEVGAPVHAAIRSAGVTQQRAAVAPDR